MSISRTFAYLALTSLAAITAQSAASQESAPTDPDVANSNALKAKYEAEAGAYAAAKARSEAEAAAAKAKFGPLADYTTEGKVEAGENSGKLEATLLASEATRLSAGRIVATLCDSRIVDKAAAMCSETAKDTVDLIVLTDADKPAFDSYDAFKLELDSIQTQFARAEDFCSSRPPNTNLVRPAIAVPAIMTAVSVAANLLRSDYKLSYLDLSQTDAILLKTFVQQAHTPQSAASGNSYNVRARMIVPSLFPQRIDFGTKDNKFTNAALQSLQEAKSTRERLEACAKRLAKPAESKKAKAKKKPDPDPKIAAITEAIKRFDTFEAKLATADDKGVVPLAAVVRQAQLSSMLDRPQTYILELKSDMAGGSAYSKKNFATFLGEMPYSVSAGSLVSYALLTGKGDLIYADVLPQTQPFMKIHQATRHFLNGRPSK